MGRSAVEALVARRIEDVVRVYVAEELVRPFSRLLKWCAEHRRAYHVVPREELDRVADSVHHEGIVVLAKLAPPVNFSALLRDVSSGEAPCLLLVLEDVTNPHNIGAILRVAAHFGARALIVPEDTSGRLSGAVVRTAEGGAEQVDLIRVGDLVEAIESLQAAGFVALGTSSHVERSLFATPLPKRVVFVLGAEGSGLSRSAVSVCDDVVLIPGTGAVESLNVATATAVLLAEHWRLHREPRREGPRASRSRGEPRRGRGPVPKNRR